MPANLPSLRPNPSIEGTSTSGLRPLAAAPHVKTLGVRNMPVRTVLALFSGAIALVAGIQAFVAVFFAPVVLYGDDHVMLVWGWVAPIVGLPVAVLIGWLARKGVYRALSLSLSANSRRWAKGATVAIAAVACVAAVGRLMFTMGDTTVNWSDEVRLKDGNLVVVSRRAAGNVFGHPKYQPESWLPAEFIVDVAATVPSLSRAPVWRSPLRPILLDKDDSTGNWYLIAEPLECNAWYKLGKPSPPYFLYVLGANGWTQVQFNTEHVGRSPNLLVSPRFKGEDSLVTAEHLKNRNDFGPVDTRPVIRSASRC